MAKWSHNNFHHICCCYNKKLSPLQLILRWRDELRCERCLCKSLPPCSQKAVSCYWVLCACGDHCVRPANQAHAAIRKCPRFGNSSTRQNYHCVILEVAKSKSERLHLLRTFLLRDSKILPIFFYNKSAPMMTWIHQLGEDGLSWFELGNDYSRRRKLLWWKISFSL